MDLAAGLPRQADRTGPLGNAQRYMRYQWITRLLGNPLSDAIMEPFSREVLERAAATGEPLSLILDQSKMSDRHQVLMLALRWGERALPLAWRVEEARSGSTPSRRCSSPLVARRGPRPADGLLRHPDRLVPRARHRLRLKGNLAVFDATGKTTTGQGPGLLSRRCRTHRSAGAHPHRHHP
jgi:hypothetical protein